MSSNTSADQLHLQIYHDLTVKRVHTSFLLKFLGQVSKVGQQI